MMTLPALVPTHMQHVGVRAVMELKETHTLGKYIIEHVSVHEHSFKHTYIHMHICTYIHIHNTDIHTYNNTHTNTHAYTQIYTDTHTNVYVHTQMLVCVYSVYICVRICVLCVYEHMHVNICANVYKYMVLVCVHESGCAYIHVIISTSVVWEKFSVKKFRWKLGAMKI